MNQLPVSNAELSFIADALSVMLPIVTKDLELTEKIYVLITHNPNDDIIYSSKEAADYLNKGVKHLYDNREKGLLVGKNVKGVWYYTLSELIRFKNKS